MTPPPTRSKSQIVTVKAEHGWEHVLARATDETIRTLSDDHDVITVAVVPLRVRHYVSPVLGTETMRRISNTETVMVTVVWRDTDAPASPG